MYVQVVRSDRKVACPIGKAMIGERQEGFGVNGNDSGCLVGNGTIYTVHVNIVVFPDGGEKYCSRSSANNQQVDVVDCCRPSSWSWQPGSPGLKVRHSQR